MEKLTRRAEPLLLILTVFTVTFFVYRDFGIRMLLGFGALCLILLFSLPRRLIRRQALSISPVELALGLLALGIAAQFLRPDARHDADSLSYILAMVICTAFVWLHQPDRREAKWALTLLLLAALVMAVFSLTFTLWPEPFFDHIYPHLSQVARRYLDYFVPQGYGIALGGYTFADYVLFCGAAVCCGLLMLPQRAVFRLAEAIGAVLFVFVMFSLGRRGELLGAAVSLFLLVLILCSRRQRLVILLCGGAAAVVGLGLFWKFLPQLGEFPLFHRYAATIDALLSGRDFTSGRTGLFRLAIEGFRSAPVFGIGFDQFHTLVDPMLTDIEGNVMQDAHNIYLQMLCETGLVGTALTLLPLGWLLVTTWRLLCHAKGLAGKEPLCLVCVSFLIQFYLLFLGLYDPTFQKIVFWCFYGIALMLLRCAMEQSGWRPTGPLSRLGDRLNGFGLFRKGGHQ